MGSAAQRAALERDTLEAAEDIRDWMNLLDDRDPVETGDVMPLAAYLVDHGWVRRPF